ncbi:MAG: RluA family pseudouridine synthase, partial [Phycisphaerae bacterium]
RTIIQILYQNDDILVVNKPSGVSVTKDRTDAAQLTDLLARQMDKEAVSQLRLVHRLDKDTSGVMLLAKNIDAQRFYSDIFEQRLAQKTYLALIRGAISDTSGTIDLPLGEDHTKPNGMRIDRKNGKPSVTKWRLAANFGNLKLLAVQPLTGRKHQIRVHLCSMGIPLAIDPLYASKNPLLLSETKGNYNLRKFQEERPLMERLTLHAYQLVIPETSAVLNHDKFAKQSHCFVAALDKKFTAAVKMLTKHNSKGPDAFVNQSELEIILKAQPLLTS